MKVIFWYFVLTVCCGSSKNNVIESYLKIVDKKNVHLCDAVLIFEKIAFTTCSCATRKDSFLPEFFKIKPLQHILESNSHTYVQRRDIVEYQLHPKCTSYVDMPGFIDYNFAVAKANDSFRLSEVFHLVNLPPFDLALVASALEKYANHSECQVTMSYSGRLQAEFVEFPRDISRCAEEVCAELINETCKEGFDLTERGFFCAKPRQLYHPDDLIVRQGSPFVCYGILMGVVSLGNKGHNESDVLVSRMEPALSFLEELTSSLLTRSSSAKFPDFSPLLVMISIFSTYASNF